MALVQDSAFFPSLEKCLNEDYQLLSWKRIFRGLSSESLSRSSNDRLRDHLCDEESVNILTRCLASSPPSSQSRSSFQARTSAINVTPSTQSRYDIAQIKEDTVWLSKEAKTDEVTSLRVVVLEYQGRGAAQLLDEPTERLADSGSHYGFTSGTGIKTTYSPGRHAVSYRSPQPFLSDVRRRLRLLQIYLEERLYTLRVVHLVLSSSPPSATPAVFGYEPDISPLIPQWRKDLCQRIRSSWGVLSETPQQKSGWVEEAVLALSLRLDALFQGNKSLEDDLSKAELDVLWYQIHLLEMLQISQIMLECIKSTSRIPRSHTISTWFGFMKQCAFFESSELPLPEVTSTYFPSFQANITVFSLAILKLPLALQALEAISQNPTTAPERRPDAAYILNPDTILEVGKTLLDAARAGLRNASLAIFAWSLLQQILRESANESKEMREITQAQCATDSFTTTAADLPAQDSTTRSGLPYSQTRRSSASSDASQQLPYLEVIVDEISNSSAEDDVVAFQANVAVNEMGVFELIAFLALEDSMKFANGSYRRAIVERRTVLFDLVQAAADRVDYDEDFFLAVTTVTSPVQFSWDLSAYFHADGEQSVARRFFQSETLMLKAFRASQHRFPYESLPFLTLCGGLSMCRLQTGDKTLPLKTLLDNLPTFTAELPPHIETLEARDEHDIPCRKLVVGQDMFPGRRLQFSLQQKSRNGLSMSSALSGPDNFQLPPGTLGTILSTRGSAIIAWHHSYSALKYLGKAIQHSVVTKALSDAQTAFHATQAVSETVRIFSNLLRATCEVGTSGSLRCIDQQLAQEILDEASDGLGGSDDVITVILTLFEDELYKTRSPITSEVSAELVNHCIHFLHTGLAIRPGRIWPFLAKSGFLGLAEGESQLSTLINAPEITPVEHSVLVGVVCFFTAAVDDSMTHTVSRRLRKPNNKTSNRFQVQGSTGSGISNAVVSKIILRLEQIVLSILATSRNWKSISMDQKAALQSQICISLTNVLKFHYEIGEGSSDTSKSDLNQAALHIVEVFLSDSVNMLMVQPLVESLVESQYLLNDKLDYRIHDLLVGQSHSALNLFSTLADANVYLDIPPSILNSNLFDLFPLLIKTYVLHEEFRLPVLSLAQSLLKLFGGSQTTSKSLLSCLGRSMTTHMLETLPHLGAPLEDEEVSIGVWRFFSGVISNQQQWLTAFLLTGQEPRRALKSADPHREPKRDVPSVLQVALTRLCSLNKLQPGEAIHTLEFLLCAADHSPSVLVELLANQELLSELYNHLLAHKEVSCNSDPQAVQITALIVGILAVCVHDTYSRGDADFSKKLVLKLGHLLEHGASAPPYNLSLHTRLNENFQDKFPPFRLSDFKWTRMRGRHLGKDYCYSLGATNRMLGFSPAWLGPQGKGFAAEVPKANVNLSVVEAHHDLFHQWTLLVFELSHALENDAEFHMSLIQVIRTCLSMEPFVVLPEPIATRVVDSRLKLTVTLFPRILNVLSSTAESRSLLKPVWDATRNFISEGGQYIAISRAESSPALLRILLYALQPHIQVVNTELDKSTFARFSATSESAKVSLEILDVVVAHGFRTVTTALHDDPTKVLPSDFMILTAILQAALVVPGVDQHPVQLTSHFTDEHTIRYACTLLSWSDRLQIDNDPVYGEVSIQFLLALSAMPALSESLAVEGVLTQIATTNLTKYFRLPGGKGALDEPIRMHAIWSRGILPLVLNLLQTVGAPIAGEIVGFLNEFQNQMNRGSSTAPRRRPSGGRSSSNVATWTLNDAAELQSLALIAMITDAYRDAGASAGILSSDVGALAWDKAEVKEDIEYWLQSRNALRESIQPLTEQEASWATQKAGSPASGAETRLEELVVEELNAALGFLGGSDEL